MQKKELWKRGAFVIAFLLVIYTLVPTFCNFNETREHVKRNGGTLPWYFKAFPEKQIRLGLDLQGGIHLVLGVDVDKAIQDNLKIITNDLREELKTKEEEFNATAQVRSSPAELTIHIQFAQLDKAKDFKVKEFNTIRRYLKERYSYLHIIPDDEGFGVSLTYKKDELKYQKRNAIDQALQVLRNRVDEFGVSEPSISAQGSDRILVQLPGVQDPAKAKKLIGKTAKLTFHLVDDESMVLTDLLKSFRGKIPKGIVVDYERVFVKSQNTEVERPYLKGEKREILVEFFKGILPPGKGLFLEEEVDQQSLNKVYRAYVLNENVLLTGDMLESANTQIDPQNNRPQVGIRFNARGTTIFKRVTTDHTQERLAIVLDGNVMSAPRIAQPIVNGEAAITFGSLMDHTQLAQEARDLALVLRAGSLKAPVEILEDRTIGPTLGSESIQRGTHAMIAGGIFVIVFMAFYYRKAGLVADIALISNGLLILACLVLLQATLTLPGIAGLILTIGMAVDANVIIFERIREELRSGKDKESAINSGYERAWWTVFDANITTAIAGIVLMQYGTGPIKGFAVTLLIGIIFSFITAVYLTRIVFNWLIDRDKVEGLSF